MVGSGIPALSLFLLIQGSVGEGPGREGQTAEQGASSASTATNAFSFHRWEWNPGVLLSVE